MNIHKRLAVIASAVMVLSVVAAPSFAGPLQGENGHTASGSVTIAAGQVELGSDFKFDGGPDVYVATKQGGEIQLLGKLRANSGAQSYALPAGGAAEEVLLWCKQYSVSLGKASVE